MWAVGTAGDVVMGHSWIVGQRHCIGDEVAVDLSRTGIYVDSNALNVNKTSLLAIAQSRPACLSATRHVLVEDGSEVVIAHS